MASDGVPLIDHLIDAAFWLPLAISTPIEPVNDRLLRQREKSRQDLRNARVVGELAVRVARKRVEQRLAGARRAPSVEPVRPARPARRAEPAEPMATPATTVVERVTAAEVPFDDYDTMPAAHIVQRLRRLDPDALRQTAAYESAHRNRRTVIGKIEQLLGD